MHKLMLKANFRERIFEKLEKMPSQMLCGQHRKGKKTDKNIKKTEQI